MWMEHVCGAGAITALINHGLDFKRRDPNTGLTLLDYVVSHTQHLPDEDSLALVKLLVDKGADLRARGNQRFTPLLAAANADYPNTTIVNYLLNRDEYGRMEKIEAMELVGASILLNIENTFTSSRNSYFPKAFRYWRIAHQLRELEKKASGSSAEKILGRKIGGNLEWTTLAELNELEQHPEEHNIQSLMVKLRITSGSRCQEAARSMSCRYLNEYFCRLTCLNNAASITQILDIRWGMFDQTIRRFMDPTSSNANLRNTIREDICELIKILSNLQKKNSKLFNFETIKTSLDLFLQALNLSSFTVNYAEHSTKSFYKRLFTAEFSDNLFSLLEMIFCLNPAILNVHNRASLEESLRQLGHYRLGNLLILACKRLKDFKSLSIVRLLLDAGADPNLAVDETTGNASLHLTAIVSNRQLSDAAGRLLVEFGAKLYKFNKAGKTALNIWMELNETEVDRDKEADKRRPEWCRPIPTLLCLAARVIRVHKITYAGGKTPTVLHSLIELRNLR